MRAGVNIAGSRRPYLGALRNLAASEIGYDGAAVSWLLDQGRENPALAAIYADGTLQALVPADSEAGAVTALGNGTHTLSARICGQQTKIPSRVWHLGAQRAWIRWNPESVPDLDAYVIEKLVSGPSWVSAGVVQSRSIGELHSARPKPGSGSGRLTVFGTIHDKTINGVISLIVDDSGNLGLWRNGELVESLEIVPLATMVFSIGLRVYVEDIDSLYLEGDTWTTTVGIDCNWQSAVLTPGTYTYRVKARDLTGNLSSAIGTYRVVIQQLPDGVSEPAFTVSDAGGGRYQVDIEFDELPADESTVEIYANYDNALGLFTDYINTKAPLAIAETETLTLIESAPAGFLQVYVWTRKDGVLRDDLTIYSIHLPPSPGDQGIHLGTVFAFTVSVSTLGVISIAWTYDFGEDGSSCDGFEAVIQVNDSTVDWGDAIPLSIEDNLTRANGKFLTYGFASAVTADTGDTVYCWIRPMAGLVAGNATSATLDVDIDAPDAPTVDLAMPS